MAVPFSGIPFPLYILMFLQIKIWVDLVDQMLAMILLQLPARSVKAPWEVEMGCSLPSSASQFYLLGTGVSQLLGSLNQSWSLNSLQK